MFVEFIDSLGIEALIIGTLAAGITISAACFVQAYLNEQYE